LSNLLVSRIGLFVVLLMFALLYPTLHGRISAYGASPVEFSGHIQKCDSDSIYTGRKQSSYVNTIYIGQKEYVYRIPKGLTKDSLLHESWLTVKGLCKRKAYIQGHYVETPTKLYASVDRVVHLSQLGINTNEDLISYFKRSLEFLSSMVLAIILYSSLVITLWGSFEIKRFRTKNEIESSRNQRFLIRTKNKSKKHARKKTRRIKRI
jgi:hypothetical protein